MLYHDIFCVTCQYVRGSDEWRKFMPNSSRKSTPPAPSTPPKLIVPRSEAHIEKGRAIAQRVITSEAEMVKADADGDKWRDYAIGLLSTLFDTSSLADDYENKTRQIAIGVVLPLLKNETLLKTV